MTSVISIAYVRYQAPDLQLMEDFLSDFGLVRTQRTEDALYMRGIGAEHHIHITERADDSKGVGVGFRVATKADLEAIAELAGGLIEESTEPGGGLRAVLKDPNGFRVDVIFGGEQAAALKVREPLKFNDFRRATRLGVRQRPERGASHVVKIEHSVLAGPHFEETLKFYQSVLGLKISDTIYVGSPEMTGAAFLHCGLGQQFTDHHSLALIRAMEPAIDHSAFVTLDWDDLMLGHQHLKAKEYYHDWGIGRHIMGSEIFDYWRDPFGNKVEHCFDSDLVNDEYVPSNLPVSGDIMAVWAPDVSATFHEVKAGAGHKQAQ